MARENTVLKCGWLNRQSEILKRWKRNWFVLCSNGDLKYFETNVSHDSEDTIIMNREVAYIKTANQCEVDPPQGITRDALFALVTHARTYFLCADDADDMLAWKFMLDEAKTIERLPVSRCISAPLPANHGRFYNAQMPTQPPAYNGGARVQRVVYNMDNGSIPARIVYHPDGTTVVIYDDNRPHYCYGHHRHGCDCSAANAALGIGLGSMLLWPFLWAPMLWF